MQRIRVRIDHVHGLQDRQKYGRLLVQEINRRLYDGWNPLIDKIGLTKIVTIADAVALYRRSYASDVRPDSLRSYDSFVSTFLEYAKQADILSKPVFQFGKPDAQRYMLDIEQRGLAAKTYNNYLHFMGQFFNFCLEKGLTCDNPFASLKTKRVDEKIRKIIPPEMRSLIWDYFDKNGMSGFRLICLLTFHCLIRPKEILMLRVADYDRKNNLLIIPAVVAKNHSERQIALSQTLSNMLLEHIDGKSTELLMFSDKYVPGRHLLSTRDTGRTWSKMRKDLCLPDYIQFYSLKDTGITEMLEAGVPAKMVQELADHHSLEMTQKYVSKSRAADILKNTDVLNF